MTFWSHVKRPARVGDRSPNGARRIGVTTAIVLFTRDLRVHDHPALTAAVRSADRVVPLFVLDETLLRSSFAVPNRLAFLLESLADLDGALRERGAALVVRRGDVAHEAMALAGETGAHAIHLSADVSAYARMRLARLERAESLPVLPVQLVEQAPARWVGQRPEHRVHVGDDT